MIFKTRVVIVGGGAAGMLLAMNLASEIKACNLEVTLIDCKAFYEYTPSLCSVLYEKTDEQFRSHFEAITMDYASALSSLGVRFVLGSVEDVNTKEHKVRLTRREGSIREELEYDYIVLCTGSRNHSPWTVPEQIYDVQSRQDYLREQRELYKQAQNIVCIGGGAVGVELVAEIACRSQKNITFASPTILNGSPPQLAQAATRVINNFSTVQILREKSHLRSDGVCETESGKILHGDIVYQCTGTKPNSDFLKANHPEWLDDAGYIKVDDYLRVCSTVYAIGDVNTSNEPKMFFTAHMQAIHCFYNIKRMIRKINLIPYQGSRENMVVSLGPTYGVGIISGVLLDGRPFGKGKGSRLVSFTKHVIERISMNDFYTKRAANILIYRTNEKGQLFPRMIDLLTCRPRQIEKQN